MKSNEYSLTVFVNDKPVHEYPHNGTTFIEGRKSSTFEIEFRNHTASRVLVVPAVDGVSTLNGERANADSPGYVVKGHDTLRIKGWTVDGGNVAQFLFQDKERSYGSHAIAASQAGVVGVLVYKEQVVAAPVIVDRPVYIPTPVTPYPWVMPVVQPYNGPTWITSQGIGTCNTMNISNCVADSSLDNVLTGGTLNCVAKGDLSDSPNVGETPRRVQMSMNTTATASLNSTASSTPFELGTGWGDKVEMKTNQVTFNRGDLAATISIYYDSRRNLEKRGIDVLKREPRVSNELPQAFAGIGCKPPPGWNG